MQPSSTTRIQLCGRIAIELFGRRLEQTLPGRQGRVLFAYLVASRPRPIARDELKDVLWGYDVPAACDSSLSGVLSRLRRALGTDIIRGRTEISIVLPVDAWIDLEAAREAIHRAECAVESAAWTDAWGPARVALNVTSRGFLAGEDAPWIDEQRSFLRDVRLRALECIARVGIALGGMELVSAERCGRALVELEPYRESGYRVLMEALAAEGNDADALRIYDRLRLFLREELGTAPAAATQALHKRLLQLQA